jgi:outer membrane lipoprotein-sorting protein
MPAAAGALIVAGTLGGTVVASADAGLPAKTAEELLVDLQTPQSSAVSGTVVTSADLGLPELPMGTAAGSGPTAVISGSHTVRLWSDGSSRIRLALLGTAEEYDIIRDGQNAWVWSSADRTADHYALPTRDPSAALDTAVAGMELPRTPQEAAALVLASLDGTTKLTTSGVAKVAGRDAYELILTPTSSQTLVSRVIVAMDAETHVPLRVQVFSTRLPGPAFEVGFTSVDFSVPDASLFSFTPPPGAVVTEHAVAGESGLEPGPGLATGQLAEPTVVGTGWEQVVIGSVPADLIGGQDPATGSPGPGAGALALLQALPTTTGAWGSGRIVNGTLFSAILTDDGRYAVGAVPSEALAAALAAT